MGQCIALKGPAAGAPSVPPEPCMTWAPQASNLSCAGTAVIRCIVVYMGGVDARRLILCSAALPP